MVRLPRARSEPDHNRRYGPFPARIQCDTAARKAATQALKSLVDRLPQAFGQTADVLAMLAADDKVTLEQGDPTSEAATTAAELRSVAVHTEQLAKELSHRASALFLMGGR